MLRAPGDLPILRNYFTWIQSGPFTRQFGFMLDHLSGLMILIVTGVGFLIHVYSVGYMSHEAGYYRYFAYLNLFVFFMLTLVLANNYLLMFVGWEGVGLVLLPADRILVYEEIRSRCRQEGIHRQSRRRLRIHPGDRC